MTTRTRGGGRCSLTRRPSTRAPRRNKPLTSRNISLAWMPFILMSVFLMLTGLVREKEGPTNFVGEGRVQVLGIEGFTTNYGVAIPTLHKQTKRDPQPGRARDRPRDRQGKRTKR